MRQATVLGVVTSLCLLASARADIRVPPEKEEPVRITSKVTIKRGEIKGVDRNVVAKIILPANLVHPAEAPKAGAAPRGNKQGSWRGNPGTWIAGIALSLAAISLVFVVRGKRTTRNVAVAVLCWAVLLGTYGAVQANAPPPIKLERPAAPQIVIELVEEGDSVTLRLAD